MKSIITLLVSTLTALAVMAQQTSIVTINVKGDRNKDVLVDGQTYTVARHITSTTAVNIPITISNLSTGQHTLQIRRSNQYNNATSLGNSTVFSLRRGYDLTITVNSNGSIQLTERRAGRRNTNYPDAYRLPMSAESFNDLLRDIRYQRTNNSRYVAINNAFNNSMNYFTSYQAHQMISLVNSQSNRLTLAKTAYKTITDPSAYTSTMRNLILSQANRRDLDAYVWNYDQTNRNIPGTTKRVPMPDQNFNDLVRRISNRWGLSVKMNSLTEEFNKTENNFTTMQARQLIQLVSDETNRLQLGKLAYDNVVDPQNFYQLYDVLASQSSRNELDAYVKANYSSASSGYYPVQSPMTGESFSSLYNDISSRWGIGAKMTALTDVFANSSYYFTTAQSRQLIQLVSAETNRLELAKSAYDNIVDPENFNQVYDLFTSQASRNELAAYVNSYSYNR